MIFVKVSNLQEKKKLPLYKSKDIKDFRDTGLKWENNQNSSDNCCLVGAGVLLKLMKVNSMNFSTDDLLIKVIFLTFRCKCFTHNVLT